MIYKSLTLKNFKSFKGKHTFNFMDGNVGLYLVKGNNLDEPSLGANGAGKSTIIDAIVWCLYGSTVRNLRGKHIRHWDTKGDVSVMLEVLTDDGKPHLISRRWNPNRLSLDGTVCTQEELNKFIGLSKATYMCSAVIGQFETHFFDLPPAAKTTVLTEVLDLDYWNNMAEEAKAQEDYLRETAITYQRSIERHTGRIRASKENLSTLRDQEAEFSKVRENKLRLLSNYVIEYQGDIDSLTGKLNKLEAFNKECSEKHTKLSVNYDYLGNEAGDVSRINNEIRSSIRVVDADINRMENQKKRFNILRGNCPECMQEVSEKHVLKQLAKIDDELQRLFDTKDQLEKDYLKSQTDVDFVKESQANLKRDIAEIERKIRSTNNDIMSVKVKLEGALVKQDNVKREIAELPTENPFTQSIKNTKAIIKEAQNEIAEAKTELEEYEMEAESCGYWRKGFKSVRLMMIDSVLSRFEIEINNSLVELGLDGWSVEMAVEQDTLSGGVKKGMFILVKSPGQSEGVPWEAWSGGESQRLRIAGTMALANLVRDSSSHRHNVMFWDEPSNHLGGSGLDDLISYLHQKAIDENGQIYLIDHRLLSESGVFSGIVDVIKKNDGSSINVTA